MLIDLNWATLAHYRKEQKAMMLHKIVHHLVDIPSNNYLIPTATSDITRGHHENFCSHNPQSTHTYIQFLETRRMGLKISLLH